MWKCASVPMLLLVVLLHVNGLQNPYCAIPCGFGGGRSFLHTVCERDNQKCGPSVACGGDFKEIEMTDELRQYAVDLHNKLRNKVASGKEFRDHQPSAKKMLVLKYNKELEFIAQCWANTCQGNPLVHDVCRGTKRHEHVGQNLGFINSTSKINIKQSLHQIIMSWYDEVALHKRDWVANTRDRGVQVGHYTQMIWADTDSVGCAITSYTSPNVNAGSFYPIPYNPNIPKDVIIIPRRVNDKWQHILIACNYAPGGNYIGAPVYDVGTPCSGCPKNQPCGEYSALCGKSMKVRNSTDHFTPFFRF